MRDSRLSGGVSRRWRHRAGGCRRRPLRSSRRPADHQERRWARESGPSICPSRSSSPASSTQTSVRRSSGATPPGRGPYTSVPSNDTDTCPKSRIGEHRGRLAGDRGRFEVERHRQQDISVVEVQKMSRGNVETIPGWGDQLAVFARVNKGPSNEQIGAYRRRGWLAPSRVEQPASSRKRLRTRVHHFFLGSGNQCQLASRGIDPE